MKQLYPCCCVFDFQDDLLTACLFKSGRKLETRPFRNDTKELLSLADWLLEADCQIAVLSEKAVCDSDAALLLNAHELNIAAIDPKEKGNICELGKAVELLRYGKLKTAAVSLPENFPLAQPCSYRASMIKDKSQEIARIEEIVKESSHNLKEPVQDLLKKNQAEGKKAVECALLLEISGISPMRKMLLSKMLEHIDDLNGHIQSMSAIILEFNQPPAA